MTKLISTKPIIFRVIAPLALGLILFSGVNGWGGDGGCGPGISSFTKNGVTYACSQPSTPALTAANKNMDQLDGNGSKDSSSSNSSTPSNELGDAAGCGIAGNASQLGNDNTATKQALKKFALDAKNATKDPNAPGYQHDVACQKDVMQQANVLTSELNSLNSIDSGELCTQMKAFKKRSLTHPISTVEASKGLASISSHFNDQANDLGIDFANRFRAPGKKNPAKAAKDAAVKGSTDNKNDGNNKDAYQLCTKECGANQALFKDCNDVGNAYADEIGTLAMTTNFESLGAQHTWTAVKVGMGLAAVGGVVAIVKGIQHHNDANKRAKVANAYNNGILTNADGTTTDCTTAQNYLTEACQPVLMHYCTETQHAGGTGCQTFQSSYCALSTSNASYCLAGAAATYCQSFSGSSPACQWMATRPASCQANPYDQSCLTSLSNSQLATQCSSYPNDPLCQAFTQGKVVNQAGAANIAMNPLTNTTTAPSTDPALTAPVASFNQLIDTGSTSSASTSPTPTDGTTNSAIPSPTNTNTGGLTVRAQVRGQPVANLWAANSGTTVAALCGESGCH